MINFYNQVPSIYINTSRDFQYLSWLINIVLNSVKHNVDDIYALPNTKADPRLTELLALTLGFKVKRNYDKKQLAALVSSLPSILKFKGTKTAVILAGKALLKASGAYGMFDCEVKDNCLEVLLPEELVDTTLFMDLLPYILPAGITCRIVRKTQNQDIRYTEVDYNDTLWAQWYADLDWDSYNNTTTGLTSLFTSGKPEFTNYKQDYEYEYNEHRQPILNIDAVNTGLLDNTIIPVLETALTDDDTISKAEDA